MDLTAAERAVDELARDRDAEQDQVTRLQELAQQQKRRIEDMRRTLAEANQNEEQAQQTLEGTQVRGACAWPCACLGCLDTGGGIVYAFKRAHACTRMQCQKRDLFIQASACISADAYACIVYMRKHIHVCIFVRMSTANIATPKQRAGVKETYLYGKRGLCTHINTANIANTEPKSSISIHT